MEIVGGIGIALKKFMKTGALVVIGLGLVSGVVASCTSHHPQDQPGSTNIPIEPPRVPINTMGTPKAEEGLTPGQASKTVTIKTTSTFPAFQPNEFSVQAGQIVSLIFENKNTEGERHGLVITMPGKADEVGRAATESGPSRDWTPPERVASDVVASAGVIKPGSSSSITFRAPEKPGDYPFICPVSQHWREMRGTMHVTGSAH